MRGQSDETKNDQLPGIDGGSGICDGSRRSVLPSVSGAERPAADKPTGIHSRDIRD